MSALLTRDALLVRGTILAAALGLVGRNRVVDLPHAFLDTLAPAARLG